MVLCPMGRTSFEEGAEISSSRERTRERETMMVACPRLFVCHELKEFAKVGVNEYKIPAQDFGNCT